MKDNTKITLTVGQLKRLVKESDWNRFVKQCDVEFMLTPEIKKAVEKYVMFQWKARNGEKDFLSAREIYDLVKFLKDKDILVGDDDVRIGEKKVAEIEHNYSSHRRELEYKELKPKVRWLGIDVDLKPIYPELEVKEGASMPKDKRFELLNVLEQGQHAFNTLYQEVSNPSESFDEIVKYETKEIKESLAKFQQLLRSSKVEPMNEDEGNEPEKFLDDWIMPDQLTDEEFTDFTYFVDDKTGTEAYSRYEKKMPEALFNKLYAEWEKEYFK